MIGTDIGDLPFKRLDATKTFSVGNVNKVSAMDVDEGFIYAATYDMIIKANKLNINDFGVLSLSGRGHLGQLDNFDSVTTLSVDATHLYLTAQATENTGGVLQREQWLLKVDKNLMELVSKVKLDANDKIAYAMTLDNEYLYTGMYTVPGRVLKWRKTDLQRVARLELSQGEDDVRALITDASDPLHVYAVCRTSPGRIVKVRTDNSVPANEQERAGLAHVQSLTLADGEDRPLAGAVDRYGHLYVGTSNVPAHIVKVRVAGMVRLGQVSLEGKISGSLVRQLGNVVAMEHDNEYLYAGTFTEPGRVVRVRKSPFAVRDVVHLGVGEDRVAAMTHAGSTIFVGMDTSPAKVVQVSGYLEPLDCKLSAWAPWSACSSTCRGGTQHRQRVMLQPSRYGGITCESLGMPALQQPTQVQTRACHTSVVCPVPCHGGMIWVAGSGTLPQRTCDDRSAPTTATGLSQCQCPPARPYLHPDGFCATASVCDRRLLHKCPEADLTCSVTMEDGGSTGRIVVQRHSTRNIENYHCRHHPNSVESCRCLCRVMVNGTQVNTGGLVSASAAM